MKKYRNTYVNINLENIEENVRTIIKSYGKYKYYFGVVKADSYGHYSVKTVKSIIEGGCNYLAVSSLEEALTIRKKIKDIPILCLGYINPKYMNVCIQNNVTITITSQKQLEDILDRNLNNMYMLKAHIKIDTGMNRLGIKEESELLKIVKLIRKNKIYIEGVFTHIFDAKNSESTEKQLDRFEYMINKASLQNVKILHAEASDALTKYSKRSFLNGCRLGIIMYGFTKDRHLKLNSTFSLCSEIIQIKEIKKGETVGYSGIYKAKKDEIIGIIPIGYADGITRNNTGRYVYINEKKYNIIGNICMDMLMVKIDTTVKEKDKVYILKDTKHIEEVAKYTGTIPYEIICLISKRVPRIYIK